MDEILKESLSTLAIKRSHYYDNENEEGMDHTRKAKQEGTYIYYTYNFDINGHQLIFKIIKSYISGAIRRQALSTYRLFSIPIAYLN